MVTMSDKKPCLGPATRAPKPLQGPKNTYVLLTILMSTTLRPKENPLADGVAREFKCY